MTVVMPILNLEEIEPALDFYRSRLGLEPTFEVKTIRQASS